MVEEKKIILKDIQHIVDKDQVVLYEVNIDFDKASQAWLANKRKLPNSMYKYICLGKTVSGGECKRKPINHTNFCSCHS